MRKTLPTLATALLLAPLLIAADSKSVERATDTDGVRAIALPVIDTPLPPGPGRETVAQVCIVCHSQRYILMQPRFSKEGWTGTVDKMRKTFGAQVTEQQATEAIDYLFSIRGTGQQQSPAKAPTPQNPGGDVQKK